MGPTGSGKSQVGLILPDHSRWANRSQKVIDTLTGQNTRVGKTLKSYTDQVCAYRILSHEKYYDKLVLVDTPGLNAYDALETVTEWMENTWVGPCLCRNNN